MGSLRNPIGPLPSSIYWRRRAVLLSLVAVLALLILWIVNSGGGHDKSTADGRGGKHTAVPSITPGPSGSGPAISEHPGGRDESSGGGDDGFADSGGSDGSGDTDGGDGSGSAAGGSDDGAKGGGGAGDRVPAGSSLPNCTSGAVTLTLRSVHNSYGPGDKPHLELIAKNTSGHACKVDLGPKQAVVTITQAGEDKEIWSSDDCPTGSGSLLLRVPADGRVTQTIEWDRKASAPHCATPPAGSADAGTYLVEAKAPGLATTRTSFVLAKD